MRSLLMRRGAAAVLVVGILATAAAAQEQPLKPKLHDRDPFLNQSEPSPAIRPDRHLPQSAPRDKESAPAVTGRTQPSNQAVAVKAPDVKVTGIVASGGKRSAILTDGNRSRIVSEGARLADYHVTGISRNSVTFSYGCQKFEVPISSEF